MKPAETKSLTIHNATLPPSDLDRLLQQFEDREVWSVVACYFDGTPDCLYGPFDRAGQIRERDYLREVNPPGRQCKLFLLLDLDEIA